MPERSLVSGSPPSNSEQLVLPSATNSLYDNDMEIQLLLLNDKTNQKKGRTFEIELVSRFAIIGGHQNNAFKVLVHFYKTGCSFAKDIQKTLGLSRDTSHRLIVKLVDAGFIEPVTKTDIPRKAGKKTVLYSVPDVTKKEIDEAISRDMRYSSKSYSYVEKLYQRTLPEIERESIQYSKIVALAKRQGGQGFHFMDLAEHVARKHKLAGVKVWR